MNRFSVHFAPKPTCLSALALAAVTVFLMSPNAAAFQGSTDYRDSYPKNRAIDILHYTFELSLSDESDTISGTATIDARYIVGGQSELVLDLIGVSDQLQGKGMTVDGVFMQESPLQFGHSNNQIRIALGREMSAGERAKVRVSYHGIPATGLIIGDNKYGDRTFFSDNWSSRARNWLPTVDHPYDKATSELIVSAPDHYQVVSNGLLVEETDLGNGIRRTHWKNSVPIATWLYALGVAEFAVQYVDQFDGKSIQTWVYQQDRQPGFYDFAVPSKQTLAYYTDLIGPYSYEKLANVQTNSVGGGMEAASSVFYSDQSVSGNRDRRWQHVIIHEIAHQWFGNAVTEYEWNDVWLSEGFATYYTLLYRNYAYGHDDFIAGLQDARQRVIDYYKNDYDFQVVRPYVEDLDKVSGPMMYQKGAWTLHMLRDIIGVDAYNSGVRSYYAEFKDRNASTADFRRHMEEASGRDLEGYFHQWLFQGGIPQLDVSLSTSNRESTLQISQVQPTYDYDITVEVRLTFADGSTETARIPVGPGTDGHATRTWSRNVVDVVVDPDTKLLATWTVRKN